MRMPPAPARQDLDFKSQAGVAFDIVVEKLTALDIPRQLAVA